MKNFFFLAMTSLVLSSLLFTSCTDDGDECTTAPAFEQNIIGTWSVTGLSGTFEFLADGTLSDPDGVLIDVEVNGVVFSEKSYVINNSILTLTANEPNGVGTASVDFELVTNDCDAITLEDTAFQQEFTMNRQ